MIQTAQSCAALLAALLALPAAAADAPPPAPYYSVHVATFQSRDDALAKLGTLAAEPAARAEKRRSGYLVRFGAWTQRAEAEAALARHPGEKEARVLQIENPVDWLLASGEVARGAGGAVAAKAAPPGPPPVDDATLQAAARRLDGEVRRWIGERGLARGDGFVYGMDVAPLLLYAAQRKDAALYGEVLAAATPLIVTGDDAATRGFVLWRHKAGEAPEVSGATEALWLARALMAGSRRLGRADDRTLALSIVDGYARHATAGEPWMVRKYYAFGTKSYASLSVLPNYAPDFVEEAEGAGARAKGVARKSYTLLQRAVTPSRLLVPLMQPDLETVLPGLGVSLYAPNNLVVLEDSCAAAEGALRGVPQLAQNVLGFVGRPGRTDANGRLLAYYHRQDGRPLGAAVLSSTGYACLARIAAATKHRQALPALKTALAGDLQALADAPHQQAAPLYAAGPLLLAADALGAL